MLHSQNLPVILVKYLVTFIVILIMIRTIMTVTIIN